MKAFDDNFQPKPPAMPVSIRMPDISQYDPMARIKWLEEESEAYRADNELNRELKTHECKRTHYYWAGEVKKPACTGCMLDINRLYGARQYYEARKEAA